MKIVKFKGGLGNQMFQYAFAKLLEKLTGDAVKLDFSAYRTLKNDSIRVPRLMRFNISLDLASEHELKDVLLFKHTSNSLSFLYKVGIYSEKTFNSKYFFEKNRMYIEPKRILNKSYFDGYWQSYKYIDVVQDEIKHDFTPKEISNKSLALSEKMKREHSVFVGVRKGDYHDTKKSIKHFGNFGIKYYENAFSYISQRLENPVFYIFTNDIKWCKQNLSLKGYNIIFREAEDQVDDFEELFLMRSCNNAIIINSTYHWWGAKLIDNPNKIICCPDKWFFDGAPIDILPPEWVKLPSYCFEE